MKRLIVLVWCLAACGTAFGWGQKGHDVTAAVAEKHLTRKAAKKVRAVLDGQSPVYWSNWMDNASHTPQYAATKTWHYLDVDEGQTIETAPRNPDGDVLTAVEQLVERLSSGELTPEEEALDLKMLIHLVGDMHCPMHLGHLSDLGGNRVPVTVFGRSSNLHAAWDTTLPESAHKWSYTEWQEQIDRLTDDEVMFVEAGLPRDWALETWTLCGEIYGATPEGSSISYDYVARYAPVVELQFLRGGYRLARLLNEIYR